MGTLADKSTEFILTLLDKALMSYGQADAVGAGKQKAQAKGTINVLVKELRARGVTAGFVREID